MKLRVVIAAEAAEQLEQQVTYLANSAGRRAAERLQLRVLHFLNEHLSAYPKTGRFLADRDIWETCIPGTRIVIWYRISDDRLSIATVWHTSQDRQRQP